MLVRLTGTQRQRAGWFVALVYLFCLLVPTFAFALPGNQASQHCLTDQGHMSGMVHLHPEDMMQVHRGEHVQHSDLQAVPDPSVGHVAEFAAVTSDPIPAKAPHATDGKCCGLMCVTALPAPLVAAVQPSGMTALRVFDNYRKLPDSTPSRLYRPPNS